MRIVTCEQDTIDPIGLVKNVTWDALFVVLEQGDTTAHRIDDRAMYQPITSSCSGVGLDRIHKSSELAMGKTLTAMEAFFDFNPRGRNLIGERVLARS